MKSFTTLTIATVFGLAASGGAFAQGAIVYERPADILQPADQGLQKVQKVTPTDQPTSKGAQGPSSGLSERASVVVHERPIDVFQPADQGLQKAQKVTPTDQPSIQAFQSPTDRGSERAGDILLERPADVFQSAGQGSQKVQKVMPTGLPATQAFQSPGDRGSVRAIKEVDPRWKSQSPANQGSVRAIKEVDPRWKSQSSADQGSVRAIKEVDPRWKSQSSADQGSVRAIKEVDPRVWKSQSPTYQGSVRAIKEVDPRVWESQSPADRGSERAGDIALERPADVAGQVTRDDPFFQPGAQKVQKAGSLGSLTGVGGTANLFTNSRGGDQGTGLLLPAIRPNRAANTGAVGTPDTKKLGISKATASAAGGTVAGGVAQHLQPAGGNAASAPAAANGLGVSGIAKK